jgi:hypothetical protein
MTSPLNSSSFENDGECHDSCSFIPTIAIDHTESTTIVAIPSLPSQDHDQTSANNGADIMNKSESEERQSTVSNSIMYNERKKGLNHRRPSATSSFLSTDHSSTSCCFATNLYKKRIAANLPPLVTYDEIPEYLKDNDYILTGYKSNYTYT